MPSIKECVYDGCECVNVFIYKPGSIPPYQWLIKAHPFVIPTPVHTTSERCDGNTHPTAT